VEIGLKVTGHSAEWGKETGESVHPAYNPSFLAYFFSRNSIFLSQQISQQCFSAGLSAEPNGAFASLNRAPRAEKS
jgi:hypothetical protein